MPTRQGGNLEKNGSICDRRSDLRTTTWPLASTPWTWKTLLAKSRPIVVICIADGSHFARERLMAFTLWHPDAVSGSHPPHLLCTADVTDHSNLWVHVAKRLTTMWPSPSPAFVIILAFC